MADATKRMNYFDRQFLRAGDFQDEQAYYLDRRRRHNRLLHTPGVAEGLQVAGSVGTGTVSVSAGTAYDGLGEEIVLPASQQVDVSAIAGASATAYITITYKEQVSDPSTDPGVTGISTRTSELPGLAASATPPADPNTNLLLAQVSMANGKIASPPVNTVRSKASTVLPDDLTVRSLTLKNDAVASSQFPKLVCSQANDAALQNGNLTLDNQREIYFQDNGQIRSLDDNHSLVFNRQNNLLELHEFGDIRLMTGGAPPTEKMRVAASGNVGIGTATPRSILEVQSSAPAKLGPSVTLTNTGGGPGAAASLDLNTYPPSSSGTYNPSSRIEAVDDGSFTNDIVFLINKPGGANNGLVERVRINSGGQVGMGTPSPDRALTIEGGPGTYLNVRDKVVPGGPYEILVGVDATGGIVSTMSNHDLQLRSGGNATHLVVKANGNVGVGTTTPGFILDVAERIRLRQGATASAGLWLFQTAPGNDRAFIGMATDGQVGLFGNTGAAWGLVMDTTNGNVGIGIQTAPPGARLDVGGPVHATVFLTSSDARFKTNIEPLANALEKIQSIQGVSFEWNELYASLGRSTGRREIGVLAQDVESVFPELVTTWDAEGHKAVDYGRLTAVLVEAVKELSAQNESLVKRIEALETEKGPIKRSRTPRQNTPKSDPTADEEGES